MDPVDGQLLTRGDVVRKREDIGDPDEWRRCSAIAYADATDHSFGGPLLEDDCPHDDPPAATALTFLHGTGDAS
jgi:hypothetical protein